MEHGYRGGPRPRGPPRMPARGNHQHQPQLIPAQQRMMNANVNAWQHNNMPQHFAQVAQSPDEGLNYQQPMGDGYHAPAYPQYPAAMPSPEVFNPYPTAQIYAQTIYHSPPIDPQQVYSQIQIPNKSSRGMQLSRDGIITCSSCRHRNALAESELIKKDEEIAQLRQELSLVRAKLQAAEEELQRRMPPLQPHGVRAKLQAAEEELQRRMPLLQPHGAADAESALQQSSEGQGVSSKSLLSPNAMEFNPIPKPQDQTGPASNDSALEVPVVSAKGVSDEPSCELQAEDGVGYEPGVEEPVVQCEQKSVQTSPLREEDYQALAKEEEEEEAEVDVDVGFGVQKSEVLDPEPEIQPETIEDTKPVVAKEERSELPQQQNNNTRAANAWETRGDRNSQRQGSRRGSDSNSFGGYGRGKNIRGRDQDHFNSDRNYQKSNRANQNHSQNYRGNNQRNNDDGGRENWRGGNGKDWPKPDGQRDTNSPQQRDEPGSQGISARRWENQNQQRSERNRYNNRDEASRDGNRGQPDADAVQAQAPRGRGGRGPEDNTTKFHYKTKPQDNNKELTGGLRSGKGGSPVKEVLTEFKGDVFSAPAEFALAHCVARDFRMGSGVAVKFRNEFKGVPELLDQHVGVGGCAFLVREGRYIFYMVTKELSSGKPTYDSLRGSLRELRDLCQRFGVKKLAMPHIGCGLDRLDWGRVKHMVNETFQDCDMEVHAYEFNVEGLPEAEGNRSEGRSGTNVRYEKLSLSAIEPQTALLFLGTEDGYMDSVATSLDARFKFATNYKKTQKNVGKVWRHVLPQYCIYGIIVAKTHSKCDKVSFCVLDECFRTLSKLVRQDQFEYIGMEVCRDWNCEDTLFTEKVAVLLRNMLPRTVRQLWVCFPDDKLDPHGFCARYGSKQPQNPPA